MAGTSVNWLDILSPLHLSKEKGEPLYVQLRDCLEESIQSGRIPLQAKLPTNRQLADLLRIDRSTVTRALGELASSGLIESHVGRGTFVKSRMSAESNVAERKSGSERINWTAKFSRASRITAELLSKQPPVSEGDHLISFSGGSPASESFPYDELNVILNSLTTGKSTNQLFDYSPAEGDALLREQVKAYLQGQGINVDDDELLILSGSQQGIDLVANSFVDQGDEVIIEQPTYFWALCNFRARQARLLPVAVDDDGMVVEEVENLLQRHDPKLIYVIPDFQNPTGVCLSLARRHRLIELANRHGVPIYEDNFAGELCYEQKGLPSLRSLPNAEAVVVHQGTFSKALCPGLRIGWLVAPPEVISRIRMAKRANDLSTNSMAQVVLANYLKDGLYASHLKRVKVENRRRRDAMLRAMRKHMPVVVRADGAELEPLALAESIVLTVPRGGLFVWAKLPDGLSARELLELAEREGVTFSPGDLFFPNNHRAEFFRMCFIQNDEEAIERGIERLGRAVRLLFAKALRAKAQTDAGSSYKSSTTVFI